jgi:hypothetical protein
MELLLDTRGTKVWRVHLMPGDALPSFTFGEDFKCVIWTTSAMGNAWRSQVSEALVAARVRYMAAGGLDGTLWDDSVDWAFLDTDPDFDPPDERFVLTEWFDGYSLESVLWCGFHMATFDDLWFNQLLVLWVGPLDAGWGQIEAHSRKILEEGWVPEH